MSTYDVQDEEGPYYGGDMQDAVERARRKRAPSHIEEAVKSLEAEKPDEGYKPLPASARPYGPVEPPPPEPPSVAPPPEVPPFKPADFPVQTSAPAAPAGPSKSDALAQLQRMILSPSPASSGPGDNELVAAQQRDRQQSAQNDVTRAIQAWMFRKPFEPSAPAEEKNLLQRQSLADSSDAKGEQRRLSAQEALVKALTGDDPKPLDPSLAALHEASALNLRGLEQQRAAEEQRKLDEQNRVHQAENASLPGEKAALLADPRAKALGLTPEMIDKLDRKGLAELRARMDSYHAPKPVRAGGPVGHTLPADQVAQLGDYDTAAKSVDELLATHKTKDMGGAGARAANLLPQSGPLSTPFGLGSDTAEYNDKAKATAQVVGYILEGGKLSDADVPRYLKMLPGPGDSPERAAAKAQNVHHLLQEKKAGRLKTFGSAGYRTPADGGPPPPGGAPVKMKFPDGSVHDVDASETELARRKGGVEVDGG